MALQPCHVPGCSKVQEGAYCNRHHAQYAQEQAARNQARLQATNATYDGAWRRVRAEHLQREPACQWPGCGVTKRVDVHHRRSVRERPDLRLEPSNLVTLCKAHHNAAEPRVRT